MSFIDWITGRSKYLKLLKDQQKVIDELNEKLSEKKEVITFIQPPKGEEIESYYCAIHGINNNKWFKWMLFEIRNEIIKSFLKSGESELSRGQLSMIEVLASTMETISNKYQLSKVVKDE